MFLAKWSENEDDVSVNGVLLESNHLEPVPLEGYGEQNEGKVEGGLPPTYY